HIEARFRAVIGRTRRHEPCALYREAGTLPFTTVHFEEPREGLFNDRDNLRIVKTETLSVAASDRKAQTGTRARQGCALADASFGVSRADRLDRFAVVRINKAVANTLRSIGARPLA